MKTGLQITRRCFKNIHAMKSNTYIDQEFIFNKVCEQYGMGSKFVKTQNRNKKREFVEIRQVTMYLTRKKTKLSQSKTGRFFEKDHATCLHAENTIDGFLFRDRDFKDRMEKFIEQIISL